MGGEPRNHSNYPNHRQYERCIYFQVKLDGDDDNDDDDDGDDDDDDGDDGGCNDTMKVKY